MAVVFVSPFTVPWSPYWEHLKEAWYFKDHPNLLFMFYEEMQHDFPNAIRKVAKFLGKVYTEEQIKQLAEYLNIENFKNNPMVNSSEFKDCNIITAGTFVRKGASGGWRDMFTPDLDASANQWIEEHLKGTDFVFPTLNGIKDLQSDELPLVLNNSIIASGDNLQVNPTNNSSSLPNLDFDRNELVTAELPQCIVQLGRDCKTNPDSINFNEENTVQNVLNSQELPITVLEYND